MDCGNCFHSLIDPRPSCSMTRVGRPGVEGANDNVSNRRPSTLTSLFTLFTFGMTISVGLCLARPFPRSSAVSVDRALHELVHRTSSQPLEQQLEAVLLSATSAVDSQVGLAVEKCSSLQNVFEVIHGLTIISHRAHVALRDHALHVFFWRSFDPYRKAARKQSFERGGFRHQTSARSETKPGKTIQQLGKT